MTKGAMLFGDIHEANLDARNRKKDDDFKFLKKAPSRLEEMNARRVFINEIGMLKDPGPPK